MLKTIGDLSDGVYGTLVGIVITILKDSFILY